MSPPSAKQLLPRRFIHIFLAVLALVLLACAGIFVACTLRWPLVGDAALIHYVIFLMQHGMTPYRDIVDLNLPGTLALEAGVMALFGKGALGWRLFDLALLGLIGAGMAVICRPHGRFPALLAAVTFASIHGRDGLIQLGQRDLSIAALLVTAYALLFETARSRDTGHPAMSLSSGLCLGMACCIKPDAIVLAPLLPALFAYRRLTQQRRWRAHLVAGYLGVLLPLAASALFLLRAHASRAFVGLMLHLAPYHASLWRLPSATLLLGSVSSVLLPFFCLWVPVFVAGRRWRRFEDQALLLGFLFGIFSFFVQGRGYPYHRYPLEVFLLLLGAIAFTDALRSAQTAALEQNHDCNAQRRSSPWGRSLRNGPMHDCPFGYTYRDSALNRSPRGRFAAGCAAAGLAFAALVVVPRSLAEVLHFNWRHDEFSDALGQDLSNLGGRTLTGKVQCLDMAGGCIATLYRMQLVQSGGFLYDCYLYPGNGQISDHAVERDRYRRAFQQSLLQGNPKVLIVSSDECGPPDFEYRKLARWPWLNTYLSRHYRLVREQVPNAIQQWGGKPALPYGYRLYVRWDGQN